jgi:hypothetical protein
MWAKRPALPSKARRLSYARKLFQIPGLDLAAARRVR